MSFKKLNIYLAVIILMFLTSCRDEIITPQKVEVESNIVNNPIESTSATAYTFEISAQNNSSRFTNSIPVLKTLNLYLNLNNYSSGTVHIHLIDNSQRTIYNTIFSYNINNSSISLDNQFPSVISLEFDNFSGDFSLNLSGKP